MQSTPIVTCALHTHASPTTSLVDTFTDQQNSLAPEKQHIVQTNIALGQQLVMSALNLER